MEYHIAERLLHCKEYLLFSRHKTSFKQLSHTTPTLINDIPDVIVIHVDTNDILNCANREDIVRSIINIGLDCESIGVSEVFVSFILVKKILILLPSCVESMIYSEVYVKKMVLILFVLILLHQITYGKI